MIIYALMFIALYMVHLSTKDKSDGNKRFMIFSAFFLIILFGCRHHLYSFSDDKMYYNLYESYIDVPYERVKDEIMELRDYGFYLMTWGLAQIIPWPQFMMFFQSFCLFGSLCYFIYKNSLDCYTSVLFLFGSGLTVFYLSACRQAMALSCCIMAYELFKPRSRWFLSKSVSMALFYTAITMHRSAVAFGIIFLLMILRNPKLRYTASVLFVIFIVLFRESFFNSANEIMEGTYSTEYNMSMLGYIIQTVLLAGPAVISFIGSSRQKYKYDLNMYDGNDFSIPVASSIFGVTFYVLRGFAHVLERVAVYFSPFTAITYPYVIEKNCTVIEKKSIYYIVNALFIILFLWRISNSLRRGTFTFFWE